MKNKLLLIFSILSSISFAKEVGDISVNLTGIDYSQGGNIIISIYKDDKTWLKIPEAFISETKNNNNSESISCNFANIPYDSVYAISVVHDKNKNDKFDMKWLPYPRPAEGAGVSNNNVRKGAPKYESAQFTHDKEVTVVEIKMIY